MISNRTRVYMALAFAIPLNSYTRNTIRCLLKVSENLYRR